MAVTDAFSTALKMLGVAADIYAGRWDGSKYRDTPDQLPPKTQPGKLAFEPKGGETTPAEKKEIAALLSSKGKDGKPLFLKDEMKAYSDMRKDKTAAELIDIIKAELQKRVYLEAEHQEEIGDPQTQGLDIF